MMKIRMKVSYYACINERTLIEYLLMTIKKTYQERCSKNLIHKPYDIKNI